jgi:hypothetical protein
MLAHARIDDQTGFWVMLDVAAHLAYAHLRSPRFQGQAPASGTRAKLDRCRSNGRAMLRRAAETLGMYASHGDMS